MTVRLADPARSRIVLIGVPTYRHDELRDVPQAATNVADLAAVFVDPSLGGIDAEHCIVVPETVSMSQLGEVLHDAAECAEDLLLIYYVGHGLLDKGGELHLALADTHPNWLGFTAMPFRLLRDVCRDSVARSRVVILDSCFSGRAIGPTLSEAEQMMLGQLEVSGTYTLASVAGTTPALIRPGERHTAFTERLLQLLCDGDPRMGEVLSMREIFSWLRARLRADGLPEPQQCNTATADRLGLVRNRCPVVDDSKKSTAPEPALAEPAVSLDPRIVAPVRYFLRNGDARMAALWLADRHAAEPEVGGRILLEIGRQDPGSAVNLLHAVADEFGNQPADELLAAGQAVDPEATAEMVAVLQTRPYSIAASGASTVDEPDRLNELSPDPRSAKAKHRAALAVRGAITVVVDEIIAEAAVEAPHFTFLGRLDTPPPTTFSATLGLELIVETLREVDGSEQVKVAGLILTGMAAAGHIAPACDLLSRLAAGDYEATSKEVRELLATMRRPELLRVLMKMAGSRQSNGAIPPTLPVIVGLAPAPVIAEFFLSWRENAGGSALNVSDLPALGAVLRNMVERDTVATAVILIQEIDRTKNDHTPGAPDIPERERPATKIAMAILDLAGNDVDGAGRLAAVLLGRDGGPSLLARVSEAAEAQDAAELNARMIEAAIGCDPNRVAVLIVSAVAADESLIRLLEQVATINLPYGMKLASALLADDATAWDQMLPNLIRHDAPTIAAEVLRQMAKRDRSGPWTMAGRALQDGAAHVALGMLEGYFLSLVPAPSRASVQ